MYVERSFPKPPRWLTYFESVVDFSEISLLTASSSAILLVPKPNNLSVIVFEYGRNLLAEEAIESRFGLLVTLNARGRIEDSTCILFQWLTVLSDNPEISEVVAGRQPMLEHNSAV